jgi:hypothetical protein
VTDRMLEMFKAKPKSKADDGDGKASEVKGAGNGPEARS